MPKTGGSFEGPGAAQPRARVQGRTGFDRGRRELRRAIPDFRGIAPEGNKT